MSQDTTFVNGKGVPGQFIKRRKWWFGPPHQGRFDILTMMGRECRLDPTYQRHITFACTGCYQLHPHHRLRHYYPRLISGTNLPTSKGWIAWLAKAECTHLIFAQDYYTIESKGTGRKWTQVLSGPRQTQYQWINRAVHYRPRIKCQKTARSAVGVALTIFRTAATDDDKD